MDLTNCKLNGSFTAVSKNKIKFEGFFSIILNNSIQIESDLEKRKTIIKKLKLDGKAVELFKIDAPLDEFEKLGDFYFCARNNSKQIRITVDNKRVTVLDKGGKSFLPESLKNQLKSITIPLFCSGEYNLETKEKLHAVYNQEQLSSDKVVNHSLYFQEHLKGLPETVITCKNNPKTRAFSFRIETPLKTVEIRTKQNSCVLESGEETTIKNGVQTTRPLTHEEVVDIYLKKPTAVLAERDGLMPICVSMQNPNQAFQKPTPSKETASPKAKEKKPLNYETEPNKQTNIKEISPQKRESIEKTKRNLIGFEIFASLIGKGSAILDFVHKKIAGSQKKHHEQKQSNRDGR